MISEANAGVASRLAARLKAANVEIPPPSVMAQMLSYFALLARWNGRMNLTGFALDEPSDDALDRLLVEPVLAARWMPKTPIRWMDIGSGGGSPAIPLKILRSSAELTMVESKGRKAAFLREAVRTLKLGRTKVEQARVEDLSNDAPYQQRFEWLTMRAVRPDPGVLEAAGRLMSSGGKLALFAGPRQTETAVAGSASPEWRLEASHAFLPLTGSLDIWRQCSTWNSRVDESR